MRQVPTGIMVVNVIIAAAIFAIGVLYAKALWPWGLLVSGGAGWILGGQFTTLILGRMD